MVIGNQNPSKWWFPIQKKDCSMINPSEAKADSHNSALALDQGFQGSNRRKVPRTPCLIPVHYNINQRLYSSFILDINQAGVCVETDRAFQAGAKVFLQYLDPFSRRSTLIKGFIAWSSDAAIGVKFNYHMFTPI